MKTVLTACNVSKVYGYGRTRVVAVPAFLWILPQAGHRADGTVRKRINIVENVGFN